MQNYKDKILIMADDENRPVRMFIILFLASLFYIGIFIAVSYSLVWLYSIIELLV